MCRTSIHRLRQSSEEVMQNAARSAGRRTALLAVMLWSAGMAPPAGATNVLTVNSTNDVDDGNCNAQHCSLREAIVEANKGNDADKIFFNIAPAGPHTITVQSRLPAIDTSRITVDGFTQPGSNGRPVIRIDG